MNINSLLNIILKLSSSQTLTYIANKLCLNKKRIPKEEAIEVIHERIINYFKEHSVKKYVIANEVKIMQKIYFNNQIKNLSKENSGKYKKDIQIYEEKLELLKNITDPDDILSFLTKYYIQDMAADIDPVFIIFFRKLSKIFFKNFLKNLKLVPESSSTFEKIRNLQAKFPLFFLPNHISNADHIPICIGFNDKKIFQPVIVAGANLYKGISKKILPKLNAYKLQRDYITDNTKWLKNPLYNRVFLEYNYFLWEKKEPFLFYIEGGRSRTGKIQTPKLGILSEILKFLKQTEQKGYFVPISLSYTIVPEDKELIASLNGENISEKNLLVHLLELDNEYHKFKNPFVFVKIMDPIEINHNMKISAKNFAKEIISSIKQNIIITSTYLVATLIKKTTNDFKQKTFNFESLLNISEEIFSSLLNYDSQKYKKEILHGIDIFLKRNCIEKLINNNNKEFQVCNETLINQYANRISHLFKK